MDVHRERLAANFTELCEIDSPSRQEGRMSARLRQLFQEIGDARSSRTTPPAGPVRSAAT